MIYQPYDNDTSKFVNTLVYAGVFDDNRYEASLYILDLLMLMVKGLNDKNL